MGGGRRKLLFLVTEDSYFLSHRLPMAQAAQRAGFDVAVITNVSSRREEIERAGIRVIPLSLDRRSLNPLRALVHIEKIRRIYCAERPFIVHHIAMKPVLYGSIAAWMAGVPRVLNAFAGLGWLFTAPSAKARTLRSALVPVFRILLKRRNSFLLLQNPDDLALLRAMDMAGEGRAEVIPGSGVDTDLFVQSPLPPAAPGFICVFAARMIGIKGMETLRRAFTMLEARSPHIRLWLCGAPDPANPDSWTLPQIQEWAAGCSNVIYKGHCSEMMSIWRQAHAAVLPSDGGEGIPKALLEAASCGRPIVATDVPGCRMMAVDGWNGFLVPPRDPAALAAALESLARDPGLCARMGGNSRLLVAEKDLSARAVSDRTESLYRRIAT